MDTLAAVHRPNVKAMPEQGSMQGSLQAVSSIRSHIGRVVPQLAAIRHRPAHLHAANRKATVDQVCASHKDEQHVARAISLPGDPVPMLPQQVAIRQCQADRLAAREVHKLFLRCREA